MHVRQMTTCMLASVTCKSNGSVRKLIVADGDVAKSSLRQIAKLVAVNTSLTYLHVRDINEDDEWILNHGNLAPFC